MERDTASERSHEDVYDFRWLVVDHTVQNLGTRTKGNYTGDAGIVVIGETHYAEGKGDSATLAVSGANAAHVTDICARTTKYIVILSRGDR